MDNPSAVLRGVGIGIGIALVGGFAAGLTSNMLILIIIPVILATVCSIADQHFSFLGYGIGFGITALIFSLILNAVSPGLIDYLIFYALIFAFALVPVIFFGVVLHSRKYNAKKGTARQEQGARVPPIRVPEGVEVRIKAEAGIETRKPKSRLEDLDKQSSLIYLCPYCNAQVLSKDMKCASCGAELDHRVTKVG